MGKQRSQRDSKGHKEEKSYENETQTERQQKDRQTERTKGDGYKNAVKGKINTYFFLSKQENPNRSNN